MEGLLGGTGVGDGLGAWNARGRGFLKVEGMIDHSHRRGGGRGSLSLGGAVGILGRGCRGWAYNGAFLGGIFAFGAILDDEAHGFLDPNPMVLLGYCGGGLIDPAMLMRVNVAGNLVLALRITDDFLVFQHQPFIVFPFVTVFGGKQLVVSSSTPQTTLLGAISPVGVFAVLEIEANLVKSLLGHIIFPVWTEVSPIDDGINKLFWIGSEIATSFHSAYSLEA